MDATARQSEGCHTPPSCTRLAAGLRVGMEVVVLLMVVVSPWAFGAVHPLSLFVLYVGLSVVLVFWAALLLVERRIPGGPCPVAVSIAGMVLLGLWQLTPISTATLAAVSPATASLRTELIPLELESVAGEEATYPSPVTISFDAGATRGQVVKLLAVLALFAAVRYGIATPASFQRLAVVCVVNGAVLSVFALAQQFSAPSNVLYWHLTSQGRVYGPFVCRNHFPFFVNLCIGMGLGLLLGSGWNRRAGLTESLTDIGRKPALLWLIATLGMMLAANLYSLSRGGVLALVGATVACGFLTVGSTRRSGMLTALAFAAGFGIVFVGWFGADAVSKRLGTVTSGDVLEDGRGAVWERVLPLAGRYPVWGTGYGTFETVEPQQRRPGDDNSLSWDHAHNDYLEMLVEGGACQLLLALLAIGFVYRAGIRAYRACDDRSQAALVLGGLLGFTTAVLHSFCDFGTHIPAIVVLVTVLAAHITAAGSRVNGVAPCHPTCLVFPLAAACLLAAFVLPVDGWRREHAERFRLAALRVEARLPAGERDAALRYLEAAIEYAPDDSSLRLRLADVRYAEFLARRTPTANQELEDTLLRSALRDYLRVRAANPLYSRPHARLAGNREKLIHPDSAATYLDRACKLEPADAGLWYLAGLQQLSDGNLDSACLCWNSSLQCTSTYLGSIVSAAYGKLGVVRLIDRVLPANPETLLAAARTPPLSEQPADRRTVLARALELMGESSSTSAEKFHDRAWVLRELDRPEEAIATYHRALEKSPDRAEWRFELANLLFERGNREAAEEQVRRILRDRPDHPGARELNRQLVRGGR